MTAGVVRQICHIGLPVSVA